MRKKQRFVWQFDSLSACRKADLRTTRWVLLDGTLTLEEKMDPEMLLNEVHRTLSGDLRQVADISFCDPDTFKAGEIRKHFDTWKVILEGYGQQERVLQWISKGVDVV